MVHSQFLLMKDRRFLPLFMTQFLGAFHDNLFKNALIVMILYHVATATGMSEKTQGLLTTAAAGCLVFPFFIFSAIGGQLASRYPKNRVMQVIKLIEIGIAVFGAASLLLQSIPLSFLTLFALGTHSALFGPCKYSYLPEQLQSNELIGGNALLNTGTFLAILLGTIAGTTIMAMNFGTYITGLMLILVAVIGYIYSKYIVEGPMVNPDAKIGLNPLTETLSVLRFAFSQHRDIVGSILGKGWFFCIGSLFLSQFPNYVKGTLIAEEYVLTLFTVLFSVGIAIGGLLNNRLLRGRISATYVPWATIGLSIFSMDIYAATGHVVHQIDGSRATLDQFIEYGAHWRIMLDVFMVAIFGGVFVVPLTAILQDKTEERTRAQIMAGSSITDSLFMVISAVVAGTLISMGWEVRELFFVFAVVNLGVAALIFSWIFKLRLTHFGK